MTRSKSVRYGPAYVPFWNVARIQCPDCTNMAAVDGDTHDDDVHFALRATLRLQCWADGCGKAYKVRYIDSSRCRLLQPLQEFVEAEEEEQGPHTITHPDDWEEDQELYYE